MDNIGVDDKVAVIDATLILRYSAYMEIPYEIDKDSCERTGLIRERFHFIY